MHYFAASSEDQEQAHQTPVPIALEVETPKIDAVLQLAAYLHLIKIANDKKGKKRKELFNMFLMFLVSLCRH